MTFASTDYNHLLLVADSTRYDTGQSATLPIISSLGSMRKAWSHGTYTWPSHMAMMLGHLPHCLDREPLYNRYVQQLWRIGEGPGTGGGRHQAAPLFGLPAAPSLPLAFSRVGYSTIGSGAVSWFAHPIWRNWFDSFRVGTDIDSQVDWFLEKLDGRPFFGFLNFRETHEPYSHGDITYTMPARYQEHKLGHGPVSVSEFAELHRRQMTALEYIDAALARLIAHVASSTIIVFTSDHGECFGEDNFFGHGFLHPKVVEVPLIISLPSGMNSAVYTANDGDLRQ
jgi:Sulfatase